MCGWVVVEKKHPPLVGSWGHFLCDMKSLTPATKSPFVNDFSLCAEVRPEKPILSARRSNNGLGLGSRQCRLGSKRASLQQWACAHLVFSDEQPALAQLMVNLILRSAAWDKRDQWTDPKGSHCSLEKDAFRANSHCSWRRRNADDRMLAVTRDGSTCGCARSVKREPHECMHLQIGYMTFITVGKM